MKRLVTVCAALLLFAGCKTTTSRPADSTPPPKPRAVEESPGQPITKPAETPANANPAYTRYVNARFGFSVHYLQSFTLEPPPENGDGRSFNDGQGFWMGAYGSNNVFDHTLAQELQERKGDFDKVTYTAKGKNWFVLSGMKGTKILYEKIYIGKSCMNNLRLEYPAAAKTKYDSVVTYIAKSFKPGNLDE
ncbi:MAG: hypothetical protein ACYDCO_08180 [Armatimonadota bacterium]